MRRNVEVKARLRALAAARGAAERLGGAARVQGQGLVQADTFFRVPRGRLKLRRTPVSAGPGPLSGLGWGVPGPVERRSVGMARPAWP